MRDFQRVLVEHHKKEGGMLLLHLSVDLDDRKNIQYAAEGALGEFNRMVNLEQNGNTITANLAPLLNWQARQMALHLWEIIISSKFQKKLAKKEIFRFVKHIRNGAAHNNRFHFKKSIDHPVVWRNKVVDNSLSKKEVFPGFMGAADLIILISDISEIIR